MSAFQAAEALYLTFGDHESVSVCVMIRADFYRSKGHYIQAEDVLEDLQRSTSWMYLCETTKAGIWLKQDVARMHTFTTSADELFLRSIEDPKWDLYFKVFHWRARMYHGEDIIRVKIQLEELLPQCTDPGDLNECCDALQGLAEVAFYQGKLSETIDFLQKMEEMYRGKDPVNIIWSISRKAVVASLLGDYDLARELIHKTSETSEFLSLPSTGTFIYRCYGSAQIELNAGEYDMAESHFNATIEACDSQGGLFAKATSIRGLGEIAFLRGNFPLASQRFAETQSLCTKMGVPPVKLYSCNPLYTLPERFEGWVSFLEGRSPFATSIT